MICASVNRPEPYLSSASASPATVPGTPMPSAELRDLSVVGFAVRAEEYVRCGRGRRGLAIIDRDILVALGRMDHHEAAAADISGARITHRHRKAGGDRRIDGIAALSQDIGADLRPDFLLRHHHAEFGGNGMNGLQRCGRVEIAAAFLRVRNRPARDQQCGDQDDVSPSGCKKLHQKSAVVGAGVALRSDANVVVGCYMGFTATGKTPSRDLKRIVLAWR